MRKPIVITLGVILFLSVAVTATVYAAPTNSPLPDETPPPAWYSEKVAEDSYTVPVGSGIGWHTTYSDNVTVELSDEAEAAVVVFTRSCPSGDEEIKLRPEVNIDGWRTPAWYFTEGDCGSSRMEYHIIPGGETEEDTEDKIEEDFPGATQGTIYGTLTGFRIKAEALHEVGGVVGTVEVYEVAYGTDYECVPLTDEDGEVTQYATLAGVDEVGHLIELEEEREYMLYTSEGPWNDGTDDSYEVAIRFQDEDEWGEWVSLEEFESEMICDDSFLEANETGIAFTADETMDQMQIRVNDVDDEFDDNSGTINYSLMNGDESGYGSCADYYTEGSLKHFGLVSGTYEGTRAAGIHDNIPYTSSTAYIYKVKDAWQDDGTDSVDTEIQPFIQGDSSWTTWYQDDDLVPYDCVVETDTTKDVYFTSPSDWSNAYYDYVFWDIRPDDSDGNFGNNSGDFIFNVLEAEYNAPPADCASRYDRGPLMEGVTISSQASNGISLPALSGAFTVGNTYSVVNSDTEGDYYLMNGERYRTFEVLVDGTWVDMETFADCVSPLDAVRNEYIFVADEPTYYFRTQQGAPWIDEKSGSLMLDLYGVLDKGYDDSADCDDYFDADQLVYEGSVDADDSSGEWIRHVFNPGQVYAIHITDPAFTGLGGSPSYSFDIRHENHLAGPAGDYNVWGNWDGVLCQDNDPEDPDRRISIYFEAQPGTYEIRATGPHATNSGTLNYQIFTTERLVEPADTNCEIRDYSDVDHWYTDGIFEVNANDNNPADPGQFIVNDFEPDYIYKFEVLEGPEGPAYTDYPPLNPSYRLEISVDNGANWQLLENWLECVVEAGDYIRGYKSDISEDDGPYRVRVYDSTGNYLDNTGSLLLKIQSDRQDRDIIDNYDEAWEDGSIPGGSGDGCYAACVRPGGWLEVGAWIEYVRCRFTGYISWCPWHTDRMIALSRLFYDVEPFGTILEIIDTATAIKTEVDSYQWTDEGGGGSGTTVQAPRNFVLAPGEGGGADIPLVGEDTIWGSGEMHLLGEGSSYSTECNNLLADSLGERLSTPLCFTFNVVDQLGLKTWFQWIWDMAMIAGLMFYISQRWVDLMQ